MCKHKNQIKSLYYAETEVLLFIIPRLLVFAHCLYI